MRHKDKLYFVLLLMAFVVLTLAQISIASASEFDNVIRYTEGDLKVEFDNWFGLGARLGEATLTSHTSPTVAKQVQGGEDVAVMYYKFNFNSVYTNGLGDVEFIDYNTGRKIEKSYYFAYSEEENYQVPIYNINCSRGDTLENGSIANRVCNDVIVGYNDKTRNKWTRLSNKDIPKGDITIALMTDVNLGDYIDGVWTIAGKRLTRHAAWIATMNIDLPMYFTLNETSGTTAFNSVDNTLRNATLSGATFGNTGLVNSSGILFDSTTDAITWSDIPLSHFFNATTGNWSMGFWINKTGAWISSEGIFRVANVSGSPTTPDYLFRVESGGPSQFRNQGSVGAVQWDFVFNLLGLNNSLYQGFFLQFSNDGTGNATLWHCNSNGTLLLIGSDSSVVFNPGIITDLGTYAKTIGRNPNPGPVNGWNGGVDEILISHKYWSASEVSNWCNEGKGITYTNVFQPLAVVELNSPGTGIATLNSSFLFNATLIPNTESVPETFNVNATFTLYDSSDQIVNTTTNIITGNETTSTTFNVSFDLGDFEWNVLGCVSNSTQINCSWAENNFTFTRNSFLETNISFDNDTFDTKNSTFLLNLTVIAGTNFFSGSLNYDGRSYLAESTVIGDTVQLKRKIDIPSVTINSTKSFNWSLTLDAGSGFIQQESSTQLQNVVVTNITDIVNGEHAINFTIFDEETLLKVPATWKGSFDWFLGDGTETKNESFDQSHLTDHLFYLSPNTETYFSDIRLEIENSSINTTYDLRQYDFNLEVLTSGTTQKNLFLSNSSRTRPIIIEVKDEGLVALDGFFVTVLRFYPADNTYRPVENRQTDSFGQFVANLIENDVKYRFEFRDENNTLRRTTSDTTIACRTTSICILPFVVADDTNDLIRFESINGYSNLLNFSNSSNTFLLTWVDNTGVSISNNLVVRRYLWNGTSIVCNVTSSDSVGSLNCNVGSEKASYTSQAFRTASAQIRVGQLNVKVGDNSSTFGLEGLFVSFILLMTLILVGISSPVVAIALYLVGFIFLSTIEVIHVNPAILIAELVIGAAFIWAFRS